MNPDWTLYVVPGLLIATRWSGMMLAAPFFGSDAVPVRIKAGLVAALTFVFWPLAPHTLASRTFMAWIGGGLSELIVGVLLGLSMALVVEAATLAGTVFGFQVGLSLETAIDPTTQADSTVLATLHQLVVIYLLLQLGAHRWILSALSASFQQLPLGAPLAAGSARELLLLAGNIFVWGVQMALPIVLLTLAIDVALGFFARVAPQLPVIFIGIPVKLLCGYVVLIEVARFWPRLVGNHAHEALTFFAARLHG